MKRKMFQRRLIALDKLFNTLELIKQQLMDIDPDLNTGRSTSQSRGSNFILLENI